MFLVHADHRMSLKALLGSTMLLAAAVATPGIASADENNTAIIGDTTVSFSVGASWQEVGAVSMLSESDPGAANILTPLETHNGDLNGIRAALSVDGVELADTHFGFNFTHDRLSGDQRTECQSSAANLCTLSNLFDVSNGNDQTLDSQANTVSSTDTSIVTRQTALGAEWQSQSLVDMANTRNDGFSVGYRLGFQYELHEVDTSVSGTVVRASSDYTESLRTQYLYGTTGVDMAYGFGDGWTLGSVATLGLGGARTDYSGTLTAQSGAVATYNYTQDLDLRTYQPALFGNIGLSIGKSFDMVDVNLVTDAQWTSFRPVMAYNNNDVDDGTGTSDSTRILEDSALSYSVGLEVAIDLYE